MRTVIIWFVYINIFLLNSWMCVLVKVTVLAPTYPAGCSAAERVAKFKAALEYFSGAKEGVCKGMLSYKSGKQLLQNAIGKFKVLEQATADQDNLQSLCADLFARHKTTDISAMRPLVKSLGPRISGTAFTQEQATTLLKQIILEFGAFFPGSHWLEHDWKGPQSHELLDLLETMKATDFLHKLHDETSSFASLYSAAHGLLLSLIDAHKLEGHPQYSWKPFNVCFTT
jgi:hypothetical protein